jgi:hypothetical protein
MNDKILTHSMTQNALLNQSDQADQLDVLLRSVLSVGDDQIEPVSADTVKQCEELGRRTYELAKLRRARERAGFLPVPVADYLEELAEMAKVSLVPLLAKLKISSLRQIAPETAGAIACLATYVGISKPEIELQIRLTLANFNPAVEMPQLLARCRANVSERSLIEQVETRLSAIEQNYDGSQLHHLHETLRQLGLNRYNQDWHTHSTLNCQL